MGGMDTDIRILLRKDHEGSLASLEALRAETDARKCMSRLDAMRRSWVIHALAEETVVYRAIEGAEGLKGSKSNADERFIEHELVEGLFEKLTRSRPGSLEWTARLSVARELIARHIETEHEELFARLERNFDEKELREIGHRFSLAREKLQLLEEAKAA
jgi:hemerythrin-like domain-containing protein